MKVITYLAIFSGLLSFVFAEDRPNIIVILVDDMGISDIGCYGGEIDTPNIDRLADGGVRFRQFYNTGRCCPTRASLLTGLHPHQVGIGHMTMTPTAKAPAEEGPYQGYLNERNVTLAETLKGAGYQTLMVGKWHLGFHEESCRPLARGFDRFYGTLAGANHYFNPTAPRAIFLGEEPAEIPEDFYVTDAYTDQACEWVTEASENSDDPFFLYLAYNAPHWPLHAKKEDLEKYTSRYQSKGWDAFQQERFAKQKEIGFIDGSLSLAPHEGPAWDSVAEEEREIMDLRMAAYAACLDSVDQNVGKLVDTLKRADAYENTVIFFLSDNGGCAEGGILGKGTSEEFWNPYPEETYSTLRYGRVWAQLSNTPFRLYKHYVHEGGMSTPLIVHWPKGIKSEDQGKWIDGYGYLPDFMPTLVELGQAKYPKRAHGEIIPEMEGESLLPLIRFEREGIHDEAICWEHEGNRAIREGKWKLVWKYEKNAESEWELYNMENDRSELHLLNESFPEIAKSLEFQWLSWAARVGVNVNWRKKS